MVLSYMLGWWFRFFLHNRFFLYFKDTNTWNTISLIENVPFFCLIFVCLATQASVEGLHRKSITTYFCLGIWAFVGFSSEIQILIICLLFLYSTKQDCSLLFPIQNKECSHKNPCVLLPSSRKDHIHHLLKHYFCYCLFQGLSIASTPFKAKSSPLSSRIAKSQHTGSLVQMVQTAASFGELSEALRKAILWCKNNKFKSEAYFLRNKLLKSNRLHHVEAQGCR